MNKLVVGVNFWNTGAGEQLCRMSLADFRERYPDNVQLYSPRVGADGYCPEEFIDLPVLKQMCRDIIPGSKLRKPIVHEMVDSLAAVAESPDDLLVLLNSDIWLTPAAEHLLIHGQLGNGACFSRVDFSPTNCDPETASFAHDFPNGWDMFVFKASWWREFRDRFLDLPCVLAERAWDNAYACTMKAYGDVQWFNKVPYIFHQPHKRRWGFTSLEGNWCGQKWLSTGWEKLWRPHVAQMKLRVYLNQEIHPSSLIAELSSEKKFETFRTGLWTKQEEPARSTVQKDSRIPEATLTRASLARDRGRSSTFR